MRLTCLHNLQCFMGVGGSFGVIKARVYFTFRVPSRAQPHNFQSILNRGGVQTDMRSTTYLTCASPRACAVVCAPSTRSQKNCLHADGGGAAVREPF